MELLVPLSKWSRVSECKFHIEKQKLYCQDCNTPICFFCKEYGDHKNHKTDLLETASCNLRDHIASMILKAAHLSERVKGHLIAAERELGVVEQLQHSARLYKQTIRRSMHYSTKKTRRV